MWPVWIAQYCHLQVSLCYDHCCLCLLFFLMSLFFMRIYWFFFIHFVWHLPSLYRCAWGFYLQLTTYGTPLALCLQIYCSHIKLWLQLVCHFLAETSIWLTGFFFLFCGFFFFIQLGSELHWTLCYELVVMVLSQWLQGMRSILWTFCIST